MSNWNSEWIKQLRIAGELIVEIADGFNQMEERAFRAGFDYGKMEGTSSFPSVCYANWQKSIGRDA